MNETTFLGLRRGKAVGIPPKHLKLDSLVLCRIEKSTCWRSIAPGQCLQGISCFTWVHQSTGEQTEAGKDRNCAGAHALHKAGRQFIQYFCSHPVPVSEPAPLQAPAVLTHTLGLTGHPPLSAVCLRGHRTKRRRTEAEESDSP